MAGLKDRFHLVDRNNEQRATVIPTSEGNFNIIGRNNSNHEWNATRDKLNAYMDRLELTCTEVEQGQMDIFEVL